MSVKSEQAQDRESFLQGDIPVAVRVRNPCVLAVEGRFLREVALEPLRDDVLADTYRRAGATQRAGLAKEPIGHTITILLPSHIGFQPRGWKRLCQRHTYAFASNLFRMFSSRSIEASLLRIRAYASTSSRS